MTPLTYRIPLRTRFRGLDEREGMLLTGPAGWGEWSPFPEYTPETCARWLRAAREASEVGWPEPRRERIPVNATVPAVSPEEAHALVTRSGCTTAKVKVAERGEPPEADLARLEAVRDALGPAGKIRVDANGGWDVDTAVAQLASFARYDLEYAEQPCATLEELAEVRRRVDVPLAADESVRNAGDPLRIAGLEAADIVVLKVQPLGGVRAALEVAEAAGLPVVVSSALETSVGLAAGVALAAALPELPYACGLGTGALLDGDVVTDPLVPVDGWLEVRRPEPAPELVERWTADPATAARWRHRYAAADLLAGGRR